MVDAENALSDSSLLLVPSPGFSIVLRIYTGWIVRRLTLRRARNAANSANGRRG